MNKWKLIQYIQLFSLIVLGACTTEYEQHIPTDGTVSFKVNETYVDNESNRNLALPVQGVNSVILSIETEDGSQTIYERKSLPILGFGDELLIEDIHLSPGSYQLSAFYLTDSTGNIHYATPMEGSEYGDYLAAPLPIPFEVTDNESQNLNLEIISTAGKNPEPFGFESGIEGFRETFYFFISAVREMVDDFMDFIPAELTVSQGEHLLTRQLTGKLNKIVLPKTSENYDFSLTYGPFQLITKEISYDSLQKFEHLPLVIEMTKKRDDAFYIGGTFKGNITLSTQAALDSFGLKGYDIIEGNLTIGNTPDDSEDPILDLSPLATIDQVKNNLNIINNPELRSLEGLNYLRYISQGLIVKNNSMLESFYGLTSLEKLPGLNLTNNPSIRDFNGFNHVAPTIASLHIENMEHFIGLKGEGFENAINLSHITILANPNLIDLSFPTQTQTIISNLYIANNPALISFGGGDGGFRFISNLELNNNENLENLEGLLQPKGEGVDDLIVLNCPKLTTLSPLFLAEQVGEIHLENNATLEDITAIASAKIIFSDITIINNPQLKSLNGFEGGKVLYYFVYKGEDPYPGYVWTPPVKITIKDNVSLVDFCALQDIKVTLANNLPFATEIKGNAFNPSFDNIRRGECKP
ncbi:hypothetical protein [Cyclobacterium marinum]|uniref:hypothetical protein n=1 Tax=Cyclobacterium marinum TaxID=104 RepID=UPI0011F01474|nr:hypothetical protein [Cyclobacterium marinum]MBI0397441.1 hypothetical protein [Cyclobacterium marinum]